MNQFPLLAIPLVLAACASGVPVSRQVVVPGGQFQAVQGEARFTVRAFLPPEADQRREVIGAKCELVSSLYRAEVITPSQVVVPNFGAQSPELAVTCRTADGKGSGSSRIVTRWQQAPGLYGDPFWGGPWGPGWGGPWGGPWGWSGPGYPVSSYPDVDVTLHPAG